MIRVYKKSSVIRPFRSSRLSRRSVNMVSKCPNKLKLITFDVTETLIKFKTPPIVQYAAVGKMHDIDVEPQKLSACFKNVWKQMSIDHPNFGKESGLGWRKWYHKLVCQTFQLGAGNSVLDKRTLDLVADHLIDGYSSISYYELYPNVKNLLESLRDTGILLGVISNNDERLPKVLELFGILHYFNFVLVSYDVGFQKPSCEIFQKALEYEPVPPNQALHIGNHPTNDYFAAVHCGWHAALVHKDKKIFSAQYPDIPVNFIFNDLHDLQQFLTETL